MSGAHSEVPVSVSVEDANDSPPEFGYNEYNVTLSEATPSGTLVLAVSAHDLDSGRFYPLIRKIWPMSNRCIIDRPSICIGNNAQVTYRLLPDTNGGPDGPSVAAASAEFFHINAEDGTLVLARSLDRETQSQHHLLVMASDQGTPSLSSTAHIWIRGSFLPNSRLLLTRLLQCFRQQESEENNSFFFLSSQWMTSTTIHPNSNRDLTVVSSVRMQSVANLSQW